MADPFEIQQERVASDPRRQWGWGPSKLASNEEKDAYRVSQGEKPKDIRNDPAYREWAYNEGGYAKSRRKMRMEDEWEKQQKAAIEQQAALQSMEIQQKQFEMSQRDQSMQENAFYYDRGIKEAQQKMDAEELSQATTIVNAVANLNPSSPDYLDNVSVILSKNSLGANNEGVQRLLERYDKANARYEASQKSINEAQIASNEKQAEDAEAQAKLQADMVTYGVTPEQRREVLEPNLPAGVVRYNVNAAQPVIAAAKLSQEQAKEAKTEEKAVKKDFTSRLRDSQKAVAAYNALLEPELERINTSLDTDGNPISDVMKAKEIANLIRINPELAKAFAEAKGAAAVLDLPMIQGESDFSKYKSGDKVIADDGITVITVP
jgi:hypothetical protein